MSPRPHSDLSNEEARRVLAGESLESVLRERETGAMPDVSPSPGGGGPPSRSRSPAKRCEIDGFRFDSLVEGRRYEWLKAQPDVVHVDVHPILTYGPGLRYSADFLVWLCRCGWAAHPKYGGGGAHGKHGAVNVQARVEDVKGRKPDTAFFRLWKAFNAAHPAGPLCVVRERKGGGWETFTDPDEARKSW